MNNDNREVKYLSYFVGIYHLVLGLVGALSEKLTVVMGELIFSANLTATDQFVYLVKYLGAYVIVFGCMMILAGTNPQKYRRLIEIGILLIAIRIFQRLYFASELQSAFGVGMERNLINILVIFAIAVGLYLFKPSKPAK